jgi:hypothetical protein
MIHMGDSWRESSRSELLAVCAEEPTASVEHELLDDLVCPQQQRLRDRQPQRLILLRKVS